MYKNGDEEEEKKKKQKQLDRYDKHGVHKGTADVDMRVSETTKKRRKGAQSLAERNMARLRNKIKSKKDTASVDGVQSAKKDLMKGNL